MGSRGRKSAASLTVVPVSPFRRPEPPAELTEAQAAVWRATVEGLPADWFGGGTQPLLVAYCRHVATAQLIAEHVDRFDLSRLEDDEGLKHYDCLLRMRDRETKATARLATKLRLTNQARYGPRAAATAIRHSSERRSWEFP